MKRLICICFALILALAPSLALAMNVVSYTADFYVADYANILSDETAGLIVFNNDALDKACGAQIVVVTVDTVGDTPIESYAYTLFNEWVIGSKSKNNGLLILLAISDGEYWLMPGKGLQDYVTAGDLDEMATEFLLPSAQEGNYDEGVRQLFAACFEKVAVAYNANLTLDESLYYNWLQSGSKAAEGARFLSTPVRSATAAPQASVAQTQPPTSDPAAVHPTPDSGTTQSVILGIIIWLIIILLIVFRSRSVRRRRPRDTRNTVARPVPIPTPIRPVVQHRPMTPPPQPRGGFGPGPMTGSQPSVPPRSTTTPRPSGGVNSRPSGGFTTRPTGGFGGGRSGGGGMSRGGGTGGSFSRPTSSRPSSPTRTGGGFGGGRSGGGGMSRGGGTGGSFRGGR